MRGSQIIEVTTEPEFALGEYLVEIGTYMPMRRRIEQLKNAGIDLLAYRRANADFADGTQSINLDDYDDETCGADEIDMMRLKERYMQVMNSLKSRQQILQHQKDETVSESVSKDETADEDADE